MVWLGGTILPLFPKFHSGFGVWVFVQKASLREGLSTNPRTRLPVNNHSNPRFFYENVHRFQLAIRLPFNAQLPDFQEFIQRSGLFGHPAEKLFGEHGSLAFFRCSKHGFDLGHLLFGHWRLSNRGF